MKTPDEIKKGLEHCSCGNPCVECLYDGRNFPLCIIRMLKDALAYIQQLEAERDAAISDMGTLAEQPLNPCAVCKHLEPRDKPCERALQMDECFEWRGVCEENGGAEE